MQHTEDLVVTRRLRPQRAAPMRSREAGNGESEPCAAGNGGGLSSPTDVSAADTPPSDRHFFSTVSSSSLELGACNDDDPEYDEVEEVDELLPDENTNGDAAREDDIYDFSLEHNFDDVGQIQFEAQRQRSPWRQQFDEDLMLKVMQRGRDVQRRLKERGHASRRVLKSQMRKVITGDRDTRVRDYVRLPKVLRLRDRLSFTCGVSAFAVSEGVALLYPAFFWLLFLAIVPMLCWLRWRYYKRIKLNYFLYDFCYWANGLCLLHILVLPNSDLLFRVCFALASGPLLVAIIVWRNSLVFHSLDKITTVYIHAFPPILVWCERWHGLQPLFSPWNPDSVMPLFKPSPEALSISQAFLLPILYYILWQAVYLIKTEVVDREKLEADRDLQTSLRWISQDKKMGIHKLALRVCKFSGLMKATEEFDPASNKTKLIMVLGQLIYTFLTLVPVKLMYSFQLAHTCILLACLLVCVQNGASYYIEVFAKHYEKEIESKAHKPAPHAQRPHGSADTANATGKTVDGGNKPTASPGQVTEQAINSLRKPDNVVTFAGQTIRQRN